MQVTGQKGHMFKSHNTLSAEQQMMIKVEYKC